MKNLAHLGHLISAAAAPPLAAMAPSRARSHLEPPPARLKRTFPSSHELCISGPTASPSKMALYAAMTTPSMPKICR